MVLSLLSLWTLEGEADSTNGAGFMNHDSVVPSRLVVVVRIKLTNPTLSTPSVLHN